LASERGASVRVSPWCGSKEARAPNPEIRHADRGLHFLYDEGAVAMAVMIGIDPHKGSHTAVALDEREARLGEVRVRSGANQLAQLLGWAAPFAERTWAIEGAGGLGYLLAQQLVAAGERVVDVQPKSLSSCLCKGWVRVVRGGVGCGRGRRGRVVRVLVSSSW
jgi:hypothetical protein